MATRPVPPLHPLRGPGRPMLAAAIFLVCSLVAASTALATMRLQKPAASKPSTGRTIPPRTDHDGEPLPPGALARLGSRRYRVSWVLCQVAFSPDGRRLAAACDGVRMFDRATGRLLWHAAKPSRAFCLALSPDGKRLAAGGAYDDTGRQVRLLDPTTGTELRRFPGNDTRIHRLAFSPNGRLLASGGFDKIVRLLDISTGHEVHKLGGFAALITSIAFSPDGRRIAILDSAAAVHLCDVQTGKRVRQWKLAVKYVDQGAIAFTPDGKTLVTGAADGVRFWDTRTGAPDRTLQGTDAAVHSLALARDGKIVAAGLANGGVWVADMGTGKVLRRWQAYPYSLQPPTNVYAVDTLAFAPDGKTLATGALEFSRIRLWNAHTGQELNGCSGPQGSVVQLAFTPDGRTLRSAGRDRLLCNLDPWTAVERAHFQLPGQGYVAAALSSDGRMAASRGWKDDQLRLWNVDTKKEIHAFPASAVQPLPWGVLHSVVALSADGRLVALAGDGLAVYDAPSGQLLHRAASLKAVGALAFSPDARLLAIGQDMRVRGAAGIQVWDVKAGKEIHRLDAGHDGAGLSFSPDGRLLAAAEARWRQVVVWETATGKEIRRFRADERFTAVAFSPDGRLLAGGSADNVSGVHVWELASGGQVRTFRDQLHAILSLAWAPDGRTLASGGNGTILLWDVSGQALGRVQPPRTKKDLEACWTDLASGNAGRALDAVYALGAAPALAVPFLQDHVRPARPLEPKHLSKLLADLDSPRFRIREQATAELRRGGDGLEPALRKYLAQHSSPEARRRVQRVLDSLTHGAEGLRTLRAIAVLEDIGTPPAQAVLQQLANGVAGARRTQAARAALERLKQQNLRHHAKPPQKTQSSRRPEGEHPCCQADSTRVSV